MKNILGLMILFAMTGHAYTSPYCPTGPVGLTGPTGPAGPTGPTGPGVEENTFTSSKTFTSDVLVNGNLTNSTMLSGTSAAAGHIYQAGTTTRLILDGDVGGNGSELNMWGSGAGANASQFQVTGSSFVYTNLSNQQRLTVDGTTGLVVVAAGGLGLYSRSVSQLQSITPTALGQAYYCNNCAPAKIVVSTGTAASNFADAVGGSFK